MRTAKSDNQGIENNNTPIVVATAFPPLKLAKIGKQ